MSILAVFASRGSPACSPPTHYTLPQPELGSWDVCRGLKLERHGDVWRAPAYIYNVWNADVSWKAVKRSRESCDHHPIKGCSKHTASWWQPGTDNRVHIGGEEFHSAADILMAIEADRIESEERHRKENEVCVCGLLRGMISWCALTRVRGHVCQDIGAGACCESTRGSSRATARAIGTRLVAWSSSM